MKKVRLKPEIGKGKEINDYLRRELHIPDTCKWYEVRFAINEPVLVTAQYFAEQEQESAE